MALAMQAMTGDGGIWPFVVRMPFVRLLSCHFVGYAVYKLLNKWTKNRIITYF